MTVAKCVGHLPLPSRSHPSRGEASAVCVANGMGISSEPERLGLSPGSATYGLSDFGQSTVYLCVCFLVSVKEG